MEDIISHPTFESTFTEVAKGVPDLERIVSRIHAKTCKVRDFLKVLKVEHTIGRSTQIVLSDLFCQAFEKLSKGMAKLADESESFKGRTIFGLLRGAPDLVPHIRNVQSMYQATEDESKRIPCMIFFPSFTDKIILRCRGR